MQHFKKMMEDLAKLKPSLCLLPYLCEFSAYLQLMKNLVGGSEDVKLLTKCGVIVKFLGNETDVCPVWNSLTRGLWFPCQSQSIHQIAQGINRHCNSRKNSILSEVLFPTMVCDIYLCGNHCNHWHMYSGSHSHHWF
jgi:hypothetical protein